MTQGSAWMNKSLISEGLAKLRNIAEKRNVDYFSTAHLCQVVQVSCHVITFILNLNHFLT